MKCSKSFCLAKVLVFVLLCGCVKNADYSFDAQWSSDIINSRRNISAEVSCIKVFNFNEARQKKSISKEFIASHSPDIIVRDEVGIRYIIDGIQLSSPNPKPASVQFPKLLDETFHVIFEKKGNPSDLGYIYVYKSTQNTFVKAFSPSNSYYENDRIFLLLSEMISSGHPAK